MNEEDYEFDPYKACESIKEEMNWQIKQWEKERMEEMYGCVKTTRT